MLGRSVPMVDAVERVTGTVAYGMDVQVPGMLHARVLRSPHAHAAILHVDTSRARALPGVEAVVTAADVSTALGPDARYGLFIRDQPILGDGRVRFAGEPVAAVAARDPATAAAAIDLIEVAYDPLPAVLDVDAALAPGAPVLHPGRRELATRRRDMLLRQPALEGTNLIHVFTQRRGDLAAGLAAADVVVERTYSTPAVQHVSLEPHVAVAEWRGGRLTVWDSTQAPHWIAQELARLFRVPMTDVRVIVANVGGAFGGKIDPSIEPLTAFLARHTRRPVRLALSREEEFVTGSKHAARVTIRTGATRDGRLVAHEATCWYDGGAYTTETPEKITRGYASMGPYRVPNVSVDSYGVYTNTVPAVAFRGFGLPQMAWAHESQMDELAGVLGMDPVDLRLRNLLAPGDEFSTGETIAEDLHFADLLRNAADAVGWHDGPLRVVDGRTVRAKGVSAIIKGMGVFPASSVVRLNADGSLHVASSAVEMGQGSRTALAQIAAEAATLPLDRVRVSQPDTEVTPWEQMTAASRTTSAMGRAVTAAVGDALEQVRELAAHRLEVAPTDLEVRDGGVGVVGSPAVGLSFSDVVAGARAGNVVGRGTDLPSIAGLDPETGQGVGSPQWHSGAAAAEVEVDLDTGTTRLLRLHVGVYVGRMVNPAQCELQVHGAALFGVGQALMEEMAWDEAGGLVNGNLSDYRVPAFPDVPVELSVEILESPDAHHPHGIGETGLPPVPPAIGNAVARAIGARVPDLPLTPERVLRAIGSAGRA